MFSNRFEYFAPKSLEEALALLSTHRDDAKLLAGGQSLLSLMKLRLANPKVLIDLGRIADLDYLRVDGDKLAIGARATYAQIRESALLRDKCPATRVVMLSMHSSAEHVFRALEVGAVGFVLKESAGEEVAAAVRAAHAGRRYLSRAIAALELTAQSRAGRASPLESLSARERQVLQMVVEGQSSAEIAATVHLSPKTVETYRGRLMKKLSVSNVPGLVRFAIEHGLTPSS